MAQWTPQERDAAKDRISTATTAIGILAVGAAGAASILAWHATTEASAATTSPGTAQVRTGGAGTGLGQGDDDGQGDEQGQGGAWSGVSGGNGLPGGGIPAAPAPGQGLGGGAVRSHGS